MLIKRIFIIIIYFYYRDRIHFSIYHSSYSSKFSQYIPFQFRTYPQYHEPMPSKTPCITSTLHGPDSEIHTAHTHRSAGINLGTLVEEGTCAEESHWSARVWIDEWSRWGRGRETSRSCLDLSRCWKMITMNDNDNDYDCYYHLSSSPSFSSFITLPIIHKPTIYWINRFKAWLTKEGYFPLRLWQRISCKHIMAEVRNWSISMNFWRTSTRL